MDYTKNDDVSVSFRIDRGLKEQASKLFSELGLNMSSAIQVFFRQSVREGGLPFDVTTKVPSKTTIAALLEAERISQDPNHPSYTDMQDLLDALKS
ncbi:MAG: type II toxin-antitoxin system RelB/DinJ family antitoxin [Anaerolineaceae bacterium]